MDRHSTCPVAEWRGEKVQRKEGQEEEGEGGGGRCGLEVQRPFAGGGLPATFSFIFAPASVYFSAARSRLVFSAAASSSYSSAS